MKALICEDPDPAMNLALEEALLIPWAAGEGEAVLRVWENRRVCVVLGRAEKAAERVDLEAARMDRIPVLRRMSGGGTVVHGPGNLNISFILPLSTDPSFASIRSSYGWILGKVLLALKKCHPGAGFSLRGGSDLCIGMKKISGTAQSRKRFGLLHHLTLLVDFDLELIGKYLKTPQRQPEYRGDRPHAEFVTSLEREGILFDRGLFEAELCAEFGVAGKSGPEAELLLSARKLVKGKYSRDEWNRLGQVR